MDFTIDSITYQIITAGDINRDGVGVELWNKDKQQMIAEIFRNDKLKKIQFFSVGCDLPFDVIQIFIQEFERKVGRVFEV